MWGFYCCEDENKIIFSRIEDGQWVNSPFEENLRGDGLAQALEALLPRHLSAPVLERDAVFLEALRDAALLVSLEPETRMVCKIREDQQALAEEVICDLYRSALPYPQFLPFAAGPECPPAQGLRLLLTTDTPEEVSEAAFVDFTAEKPALRLNFPGLGFARRTMRSLLGPLGLRLLLSMWNAAAQSVEERLGMQKAALYTDLVAWLMLRRNFPAGEFAVSGEEHDKLRRRVQEYEYAPGGAGE